MSALWMLVLLTAAGLSGAWAHEVQLAGIRLGQHAHNVLQVYGQPDTVIMGETGPGSISTGVGAAPAAAPQAGEGFGGAAAAEGPGMGAQAMPGVGPGMGLPGLGMPVIGGEQMPGAMPTDTAGTQATGAGAPGRFARHRDIPDWAAPVQVDMRESETMWAYRRGDVALAFILDRDGYVVGIVIGGKRADWARTAMGEPKRTVKLGDRFETVIERYGHPTSTDLVGVGAGFSRDVTLNYSYGNNISFTLRDMRVRRIFIWEAQIRGTAPVRLPGPNIGRRGPASQPAGGVPAVGGVQSGFRR